MAEIPENNHLVDLIDEDGNTVTFEHLDTVQYQGKDYIICIPYDEDETEVSEIVIFKITADEDGESVLEQILDDETASAVYDIFRDRNEDKFDFGE